MIAHAPYDSFRLMIPQIVAALCLAFRRLQGERREEAVQEGLANAFVAYRRLADRGRSELAYPTVLARYAAAQVKQGRSVGSPLNSKDVTSRYAQLKRGIRLLSFEELSQEHDGWKEAVVNDPRTPVFHQVWFRLDFPAWLKRLPRRNRRIALTLAKGYTTKHVAEKFQLTAARVSQLRNELRESWRQFHEGSLAGPELNAA